MIYCIAPKKDVAIFVEELVGTLNLDLQLITVIPVGKSEDSCVSVATNSLSDETIERVYQYCEDYWSTSTENTQVGQSPSK